MKALITGAGGQVGRALLASVPSNIDAIPAEHADLDVGDANAVTAMVKETKPDLIINTAAYTAVDRAEREPELARRVNELGAQHLAAAAADSGSRLIQLSTDFVFDGTNSVPYSPDHRPNPLGVYGATKHQGEQTVLATLPTSSIVLRTAWVYAPCGRNFVLTMLRLMRERGEVSVVADQIGTPTSAASVARAAWALAAISSVHGIYHWTDSGVASWYDFAVAIAQEAVTAGLLARPVQVTPITTEDHPTLARRPRFSVLDKSSTVRAIGIVPPHWRANLRPVLGEIELG